MNPVPRFCFGVAQAEASLPSRRISPRKDLEWCCRERQAEMGVVGNQQEWDTFRAERSGAGWRNHRP